MKRLFNNTLITSVDYAVLIALNLVATPLLIAHFGVAGYGAFVFLSIFSIYGMLLFLDLGMEGAVMTYTARFDADGDIRRLQNTLTVSTIYYAVIGAAVGIGLYFSAGLIISRFMQNSDALDSSILHAAITFISINIFLQFLTLPFTAVLQGMRRYMITKGLNAAMTAVRYTLIVAVAIITGRIDYAFLVLLGLTVLRLVILAGICFLHLPQFRGLKPNFDLTLLRTLLRYSSVLFVSRLIGLVHNHVDKILIWLYLAVSNMAIYDVVARPAILLRVVLSIVNSAVIPEVARLHRLGQLDSIRTLFINLVRYAYMILLPVLAFLFVFIDELLLLWVGDRFVPHAYLSIVFLIAYLVLPLPAVASTIVVGMEKVRQTIWIPFAGMIINVLLSVILLKNIGLVGLFLATVITHTCTFIPYSIVMKRYLRFSYLDLAFRQLPVFGVAAVSFAAYLAIDSVFAGKAALALMLSAAVFVLTILLSGKYLLGSAEKEFLAERLSRIQTRLAAPLVGRWLN
jgi:O-antigen/teichoic acid export membrane protein